jgi:hypothetical protein
MADPSILKALPPLPLSAGTSSVFHFGPTAVSADVVATAVNALPALLSRIESLEAENKRLAAEPDALFNMLSSYLNDYLCEMKPDYDDSITGFNEAWDVMRKVFEKRKARAALSGEGHAG